jgi:hypothetical protein
MEDYRKIIREELESVFGPVEVPKECNTKNWLGLINYTGTTQEKNKELEHLLREIKQVIASDESTDFKLTKIDTLLLFNDEGFDQSLPDPVIN